jgi:hypothetical protein
MILVSSAGAPENPMLKRPPMLRQAQHERAFCGKKIRLAAGLSQQVLSSFQPFALSLSKGLFAETW